MIAVRRVFLHQLENGRVHRNGRVELLFILPQAASQDERNGLRVGGAEIEADLWFDRVLIGRPYRLEAERQGNAVETDAERPLSQPYEDDFSAVNPAEVLEIPLKHRVYPRLFTARLSGLVRTASC